MLLDGGKVHVHPREVTYGIAGCEGVGAHNIFTVFISRLPGESFVVLHKAFARDSRTLKPINYMRRMLSRFG